MVSKSYDPHFDQGIASIKFTFSSAEHSDGHPKKGCSERSNTPDFMDILIWKGIKNTL